MKFNIDDYIGHYVMRCKTEEEARRFCQFLHDHGRRWCSDEPYVNNTKWKSYFDDIGYNFNDGTWDTISYFKKNKYTILEWEDFMNDIFTKADLKTGDVVNFRNELVGIVNRDLEMIICVDGFESLDSIRSDLTHARKKQFDIVEVRRPKNKGDCAFNAIRCKWGTLVYERQEAEEMTLEQVCKLLGKEIKIIK